MYQIFKLAVSVSTPLALAGLVIAVLFYIFKEGAKGKQGAEARSKAFTYLFILALVISVLAIGGWIWTNLGYTTMEGTLYLYKALTSAKV